KQISSFNIQPQTKYLKLPGHTNFLASRSTSDIVVCPYNVTAFVRRHLTTRTHSITTPHTPRPPPTFSKMNPPRSNRRRHGLELPLLEHPPNLHHAHRSPLITIAITAFCAAVCFAIFGLLASCKMCFNP